MSNRIPTPTMGEILTESQRFHRAVGFEEANRIVAYVKKIASARAMEMGGMMQYGTEENGDPLFQTRSSLVPGIPCASNSPSIART